MLVALLPQAVNQPASTAVGTPAPDVSTINSSVTQGKHGAALPKADASIAAQTGIAQNATTGSNPDVQAKEPVFVPVLAGTANQTVTDASTKLAVSSRDAIFVAAQQPSAAPQSNAATLASLQNAAANLAAPAMQPVQVTVNTPVNQDKWSDEFSQKITWLASSNKDQTAELHLNPPQLGPVDVVIKVSGDQATALFTSPHAAVRDAIEQAMPRLRDMMADNGIMLGNATVSDQAPRDQGQSNTQRTSSSSLNTIQDTVATGNSAARVSPISRHNGIVDTFA
jgi:flagellar hook-length control protein FliK